MPCYTIQKTSVDLGKTDPAMLFAALVTLGYTPRKQGDLIHTLIGTINTKTGTLTGTTSQIQNEEETASQIKKAISGEIVKATAKKYGWQVKSLPNNKFTVIKNTI